MGWYKNYGVLLINLSIAFLWLLLVWLSYVLFPNQPEARETLSRIVLIGIATQLLVLASQQRRHLLSIIKEFFTAVTHPINLAVFRIVVFWLLLKSVNTNEIAFFSQLPPELQFAPIGLEGLLNYLPINKTLAAVASTLLCVFSFTAMIGLFTRTSIVLSVILGFYALGIPQFFGKVSHYHHLLWFPAILAASRCGDMFSCDAIFAAWKRADRGVIEPPAPSQAYALPLRFVWLLIGIIYFFPGLWKFASAGFDWALSENLKLNIYHKGFELNGWVPFFRIDHYPLLYKSAALGGMVFEMSFIFLIFWPRIRFLAAFGGIMFHSAINEFMRINFWTLQASYVAFFDWNAIFLRIGRWLYREKMYVIYDGNCKLCRRTIASLRVFDIFGRVTYVNGLEDEALVSHGLNWLDSASIMTDMYAVVQKKTWTGFSAYRILVNRIPIFWPILPLLYVWPIPKIGKHIYRRVADSRTCSIANPPSLEAVGYPHNRRLRLRGVMMVGIFLLSVNSVYGLRGFEAGWPFACYPMFRDIAKPTTRSLEIVALKSTGEIIPLDKQVLEKKFSVVRLKWLISKILNSEKDPAQRRLRLQALWQVAVQNAPNLAQANSVRFYRVTLWVIPERAIENPVNRKLLFELKF